MQSTKLLSKYCERIAGLKALSNRLFILEKKTTYISTQIHRTKAAYYIKKKKKVCTRIREDDAEHFVPKADVEVMDPREKHATYDTSIVIASRFVS